MKVHFIAIGGSAMHNLALALHQEGHLVTGSDDEIFEPSRGRLQKARILPSEMGWNADRIHSELDAVILGMHAREDNPELAKAKELGLSIYSYPEFLFEQTKNKPRLIIGGSHGKTTITSMVLHAMQANGVEPDYMVGALLDGFECSVRLSDDAPVAVFEGDEYLSSPIDRRPKFHLYAPTVGLISGIAWDHMNVFPTYENYVDQFKIFIDKIEDGGTLVYNAEDPEVKRVAEESIRNIKMIPYGTPEYRIEEGKAIVQFEGQDFSMEVFGQHNLQNMEGARHICAAAGINAIDFFNAMSSFKGASRRLEKLFERDGQICYRDFAHAPSKLEATTKAVREMYPDRKFIACLELHTFSSLNREFLDHYANKMDSPDIAAVYYSPEVVARKKLAHFEPEEVMAGFARQDLKVFTDASELRKFVDAQPTEDTVLLLMSSGNWGGIMPVDL